MNSTIHNVTKIEISEIERLSERSSTYTRRIKIVAEDGSEDFELTCFGKEEDLKIEMSRTERI